MALEHVPRCQHVKVNGVQCGSPALRRREHCYFHTRAEYERRLAIESKDGKRTFGLPLLEDANSIQVALMKVIQMLGEGSIEEKKASVMIYALQTASNNLRHLKFEPEKLTDVVIDEDTVDLTQISGPQWRQRISPLLRWRRYKEAWKNCWKRILRNTNRKTCRCANRVCGMKTLRKEYSQRFRKWRVQGRFRQGPRM